MLGSGDSMITILEECSTCNSSRILEFCCGLNLPSDYFTEPFWTICKNQIRSFPPKGLRWTVKKHVESPPDSNDFGDVVWDPLSWSIETDNNSQRENHCKMATDRNRQNRGVNVARFSKEEMSTRQKGNKRKTQQKKHEVLQSWIFWLVTLHGHVCIYLSIYLPIHLSRLSIHKYWKQVQLRKRLITSATFDFCRPNGFLTLH